MRSLSEVTLRAIGSLRHIYVYLSQASHRSVQVVYTTWISIREIMIIASFLFHLLRACLPGGDASDMPYGCINSHQLLCCLVDEYGIHKEPILNKTTVSFGIFLLLIRLHPIYSHLHFGNI
jgi:hypothetical protein